MKIRLRSRRPGHTITETAFVLMICLMMSLAIFDYSRYFLLTQLLNNAVREGARQAVATTNTQSTSTIQNTVIQYLANANSTQNLMNSAGKAISASDVTVQQVTFNSSGVASASTTDSNWYDAAFGSSIMVQVNAKFTPLFPTFGFMPSSVNVTGTSIMSSEAN